MSSKRMVFLLLAVIVAGATAFMARAWLQSERAALLAQAGMQREVAPVVAPTLQVLVARNAVHTGQIVKPDDLRWQSWPEGSLAPTYIIEGKRPMSDFVGSVARGPIAPGEPITEGKLVLAGTRGFMSAVLQPGTRAVSVPITATSAVSGFIYAGDRVDVLLTHVLSAEKGGNQHTATETVLRNARVIAMDQRLDFSPGDKPDVAKTATLELTPKQSEIVTLAVKMGDLSLVLRSLQDPDEKRDGEMSENAPAEPGDSFTHDAQVSRLIKPLQSASPGPEPTRQIFVLRGSARVKQDLDGSTLGESGRKDKEEKPINATPFTRTIQGDTQ